MGGYGKAMRAYATFSGRATRAEFWQFVLVATFLHALAYFLLGPGPGRSVWPALFFIIIMLAHALPYFAVMARRLHDIDVTGWWALAGLVPLLGLALWVPAALPGTVGPNRFGDDPASLTPVGAANTIDRRMEPSQHVSAPTVNPEKAIAQMEKLAQLRANGTISEAEFEKMKVQIMGGSRA